MKDGVGDTMKVALKGETREEMRERRGGTQRGRGGEVCLLADSQLVMGRVKGHGDLFLRLQRALGLFTLVLEETAGEPEPGDHHYGNIDEMLDW